MSMLFIFGENDSAGVEYARKNGFQPGRFQVLSRADAMKKFPVGEKTQVLLVGKVERRHDYEDLIRILNEIGAVVNRVAVASN